MFIANHTSMIDIMLMLSVVDNPSVFVGKEELTKIKKITDKLELRGVNGL